MIKKTYFLDEAYEVMGPKHMMTDDGKPKKDNLPLIQFNLPPNTLKAIIDMIA